MLTLANLHLDRIARLASSRAVPLDHRGRITALLAELREEISSAASPAAATPEQMIIDYYGPVYARGFVLHFGGGLIEDYSNGPPSPTTRNLNCRVHKQSPSQDKKWGESCA